jgi:hypothetical protein
MAESGQALPILVRGIENGLPIEFTTGTRETAERLVLQLRDQGVVDVQIIEVDDA